MLFSLYSYYSHSKTQHFTTPPTPETIEEKITLHNALVQHSIDFLKKLRDDDMLEEEFGSSSSDDDDEMEDEYEGSNASSKGDLDEDGDEKLF